MVQYTYQGVAGKNFQRKGTKFLKIVFILGNSEDQGEMPHLVAFRGILPWSSLFPTGPHSAVGNVSGNRCKSDCRSWGCEFNPGLVPYFRGD